MSQMPTAELSITRFQSTPSSPSFDSIEDLCLATWTLGSRCLGHVYIYEILPLEAKKMVVFYQANNRHALIEWSHLPLKVADNGQRRTLKRTKLLFDVNYIDFSVFNKPNPLTLIGTSVRLNAKLC